jgi:hypothetical protein
MRTAQDELAEQDAADATAAAAAAAEAERQNDGHAASRPEQVEEAAQSPTGHDAESESDQDSQGLSSHYRSHLMGRIRAY